MNKNILLLNGSTRIKGNSLHICESFQKCFINKNAQVKIVNIQEYINKNKIDNLKEELQKSDAIGLVSPMYVDAFPYSVLLFLEEIEKKFAEILKDKSFFMIGQCNFPQSSRVDPMILSGECFATSAKMKFLGAMSYGGSAVRIEGRTLEECKKEGQRMIKALDLCADDIINNRIIDEKTKKLFRNDINQIVIRPFTIIANIMFKQAKKKYMK